MMLDEHKGALKIHAIEKLEVSATQASTVKEYTAIKAFV